MKSSKRREGDGPIYGRQRVSFFFNLVSPWWKFFLKPNNAVYEHGTVKYIDFVEPKNFTLFELDKIAEGLGYKLPMHYVYKRQRMSLLHGAVSIECSDHMETILQDIENVKSKIVKIFAVSPIPLYKLPWDPLHGVEVGEDYVPQQANESSSYMMSNYGWSDLLNGTDSGIFDELEENFMDDFVLRQGTGKRADENGDICRGVDVSAVEDKETYTETLNNYVAISDPDSLNDSDYDLEEGPQIDSSSGGPVEVNVNIGIGDLCSENRDGCKTDYGDSDELESLASEEEGCARKGKSPLEFNSRTDMLSPQFREGMVFESVKIIRAALVEYSVKNNREYRFLKNDKQRIRARCKEEKCPWLFYAAVQDDRVTFRLNKYKEVHSCGIAYQNKRVSSTYLANKYVGEFRSQPDLKIPGFREKVLDECNADISTWSFYRTRKKSRDIIRGSILEQYKILFDYCQQLRMSNPGSTIELEGHKKEFRRLYICFGALKEGFRTGCRRVIGLDGCFLKGEHRGQLLCAVGIDGNNAMYPITYAVVDVENRENWTWFLELLADDLMIIDSYLWTFISDKQKGLIGSVNTLFEDAENRMCVRHLHNNFKLVHRGLVLKNLLWSAARATTIPTWNMEITKIKDLDCNAYGWFDDKPTSQWSRSHFRETNKCDVLLNNLYESFNSVILTARENPIIHMLEQLRLNLMSRLVSKRAEVGKWTKNVGPRIVKIIEKAKNFARHEFPTYSGNEKFQVHNFVTSLMNAVDIRAKTCSSRSWQLSGLPCAHAIAALQSTGKDPYDYEDDYYGKDIYMRIYTPTICPIIGPELWPNPGQNPLASVPFKKQPGRPKKARRRELEEQPASNGKKRKTTMKMRCRKCENHGHNKRTCIDDSTQT